ncbi:MAG: crossover junction endodeoxyribonuclease RuvC [Leptospiraceae bacterium]|nr:crossover junction endodeoxyribonuclease RuvC [Leptospiraceae bacterium]
MRILGLDPGFGITGWGFVSFRGSSLNQPTLHSYGALTTPGGTPLAYRLADLQTQFVELLGRLQPDRVAMEKLFFGKNITTAEGVYQARGVLLAALGVAGMVPIELTPNQIKQSVTGSGKAGKPEMMRMVQMLLNIDEPIRPDDAADALGCAIAASAYSDHEFRRLQNPSLSSHASPEPQAFSANLSASTHRSAARSEGAETHGEDRIGLPGDQAADLTSMGSEVRFHSSAPASKKVAASTKKGSAARTMQPGTVEKSARGKKKPGSGADRQTRNSQPRMPSQANQKSSQSKDSPQQGAQQ